jgi:hypothetical protein
MLENVVEKLKRKREITKKAQLVACLPAHTFCGVFNGVFNLKANFTHNFLRKIRPFMRANFYGKMILELNAERLRKFMGMRIWFKIFALT